MILALAFGYQQWPMMIHGLLCESKDCSLRRRLDLSILVLMRLLLLAVCVVLSERWRSVVHNHNRLIKENSVGYHFYGSCIMLHRWKEKEPSSVMKRPRRLVCLDAPLETLSNVHVGKVPIERLVQHHNQACRG